MKRVLGASVFLNGFRRRHALRDTLSQLAQGTAVPLSAVLDVWRVDEAEFTRDLAKLEASGLEVVVRPAGARRDSAPSASPPPDMDSVPLKTSAP